MTLIYFFIVIGSLVFVHELGHFIMAKRAGVRVEKFSLGFGPKLFGFKKGDTEYLISALPLGGYVKMAGENPNETPTGASDEFQSKTIWQRAKIAATGPITNILLAFLVMPLVFMVGTYAEGPAKVGYVGKNSPAERAGFKDGDIIKEINGRTISDWTKALTLIAVNPDTDLAVTVDRRGEKKVLKLRPVTATELKIGTSGLIPDMPAEIGKLKPGFPAEKAGLKVNDKIIAVEGKTIYHWNQFSSFVKESKGKDLKFTIERDGVRMQKFMTPVESGGRLVIGVEPVVRLVFKQYGFFESISLGFNKTIECIDLTLITVKKLFTFSLSIKTLGGPVMIAQMSGQAAAAGLSAFLSLLATISISLGILNLLPIPVLDGGMLLFLAIEGIRKKPLSRNIMETAHRLGAALLVGFMTMMCYYDIINLISK